MINEKSFENFNGIEITNGTASLVVAKDFGPRILSYSIGDGPNILGLHPHAAVTTELGEWKPYGGHRLWMAPETCRCLTRRTASPYGSKNTANFR